ncbi:MAG TPA: 23S rRNA (adenine(2503)-C(2))-methyltransferase RlmN [Nitrospiria bacterium]|nr:23S rRNA (adenine(2503)-C(2))-methyltransferase RlmN [Nitrospiria bacterium]
MATGLINLAALTKAELQALTARWGWTRYRAAQLWEWLYRRRAATFDVMTNLSVEMRSELVRRACVRWPSVVERRVASDGTRKLLIELEDGRRIESVLIPDEHRLTLCLSTQVGCTLDCGFCLTGTMGLSRNLKAHEIVGQWVAAQQELEPRPDDLPARVTNLVFMGMGEPLANLAQLADALTRLTDPHGIAVPPRRITVSTAGLAPQIAELGRLAPAVNLAVSLNAADDATRARIMPLASRYSLDDVMAACRAYPLGPRRFITFEYVLLDRVNDTDDDARRLAALLRGLRAKVNLIPWNPFPGAPFRRPSDDRVARFQRILLDRHLPTYVRKSKGLEILAACGQLHSDANRAPERPPMPLAVS